MQPSWAQVVIWIVVSAGTVYAVCSASISSLNSTCAAQQIQIGDLSKQIIAEHKFTEGRFYQLDESLKEPEPKHAR